MRNTFKLSGAIPALVTPFTTAGAIDVGSLQRLTRFVLDGGVSGVVPCGSTGEAVVLSDAEYRQVITTVRALVPSTKPVIAGAGNSSTSRSVELGLIARDAGADFLLVVNPPYNKPPTEGLRRHYAEIKKQVGLPIVAYNVPGRTGMNMSAAVIKNLVDDGSVIALKEASGSIDQLLDIISSCGDKLTVLSGDDSLVVPSMVLGARGVISVTANLLPRLISDLCEAGLQGDWQKARQLQLSTLAITRAMFSESNPIPLKAALKLKQVIDSAVPRLPLVEASSATQALLSELLRSHSLSQAA